MELRPGDHGAAERISTSRRLLHSAAARGAGRTLIRSDAPTRATLLRRKPLQLPLVDAPAGARLTLSGGPEQRTVELYSDDGLALVAALWTKLSAQYRLMYEPVWMGIPIIQLPDDIVMMQELIWKVRPDVIVECGIAHGGAAVFYASLCAVMGKGRVIGVDVEIRKYNRAAIEAHPMSDRIELIEGSSVDNATVAKVRDSVRGSGVVLVTLDSDHSRAHVRQELELYAPLVTPGSYIVAMDGAQGLVADIPRARPEWRSDNPIPAIEEFVRAHPEFVVDPHYTRLLITSNPSGYLRRLRPEEVASR